jgi:hypothetical protein
MDLHIYLWFSELISIVELVFEAGNKYSTSNFISPALPA